MGNRIPQTIPTTTVFVLTTIPRTPTTSTLPEVQQVEFQKIAPIQTQTVIDEAKLCDLAFNSPSGEYLIADLFIWAAENLEGDKLDVYFDHTQQLILRSIDTKPCKRERANEVLEEARPFIGGMGG